MKRTLLHMVKPGLLALAGAAAWTAALAAQDRPPASAPVTGPVSAPVSAHAEADSYRDKTDTLDPVTQATGERVYGQICSSCHETGMNRAPQRFILAQMTPESVLRALTSGVMQGVGGTLTSDERKSVAQYVTGHAFGDEASLEPRRCALREATFDMSAPPAFAGWGIDARSTHEIPADVSRLSVATAPRLKLKWALAFPNALRARSQPAIAGGAIFVGSHNGTVYALDIKTGCARWTYSASAEVRTGIVVSPWTAGDGKAQPLVYFGDLVGSAYAIDMRTGKEVWKVKVSDHAGTTLTGTPVLHGNKLYVPVSSLEEGSASKPDFPCCTFRGAINALDPKTGAEIWRTYLVDEPKPTGKTAAGIDRFGPSGVPVWNTPSIDVARNQMYVATGDNYSSPATDLSDSIVALDLTTGAIKWHYQALANDAWNGSCDEASKVNCPDEAGPDADFGAGTVLAQGANGKDYVLAGQKSGWAYAIDPDNGRLVWKQRVGRGGVVGGIHFGLAASGGTAFFPVSDVPDGRTYDIDPQPGIFALDVATGRTLWAARPTGDTCRERPFCHAGYGGSITVTNGLVLAGGNDGYLRIYDAANGRIVWETDTTTNVVAVDGRTAHGGSIGGGAAPVAYDGLVIANSGYGFAGKMPGNVLLVYEAEK
ncbi:outer membrane protein assembly factor BamB family protein [Novosphingobium cyanobacteriorum]|uniref:PQQ-binding-like beta-propeller repeat protein n=1 Tax=Novosphingobium cyanobacteriorum TaxID=3024215 RepID=A0ABT6CIY6_9SPHN|nr:PQQ-binding-like beta-propeller repeat protein [Novosphingobium cyanobacteriorum]MDF8333777.1 PQQ-binding-like beta-propeller repeat protein [Novosphingobium cyanobacteriorum]